jgi:transcriptional regulator with XRE-family HTH domain
MSYISNDNYIKAFGKHLRETRIEKGLTCEKLEELTSIDAKQISRLERGERSPTLTTIYYLAKGLDIKPKKLLDFDFSED